MLDEKFGLKHILAEWFKSWENPLKCYFVLCKNIAGSDGLALGGYMVILVEGNKLRLLYSSPSDFSEYINASDREVFNKLAAHLPEVYTSFQRKGWL